MRRFNHLYEINIEISCTQLMKNNVKFCTIADIITIKKQLFFMSDTTLSQCPTNSANKKRKILVTCALPYANGSIHLGHLLEHIQTDIWVRFQRMRGHETYFVCADDAHGTPIMLKAQELGITPEAMINDVREEHMADFADFHISFDNYHSTHCEENELFYSKKLTFELVLQTRAEYEAGLILGCLKTFKAFVHFLEFKLHF